LPDFLERNMTSNVGGIDRVLRILVGIVLLALTLTGTIGAWGWLGVVPLATGLFKFCPVYPLLGLNSCPMKSKN
jgi:O-antigen ligase